MKKILLIGLFLISLIALNPKAEAAYSYRTYTRTYVPTYNNYYRYQQVNGYYKPSTQTYVQPYIRGVKNNVTYDNKNYYYYGINGKRIYPNR